MAVKFMAVKFTVQIERVRLCLLPYRDSVVFAASSDDATGDGTTIEGQGNDPYAALHALVNKFREVGLYRSESQQLDETSAVKKVECLLCGNVGYVKRTITSIQCAKCGTVWEDVAPQERKEVK